MNKLSQEHIPKEWNWSHPRMVTDAFTFVWTFYDKRFFLDMKQINTRTLCIIAQMELNNVYTLHA